MSSKKYYWLKLMKDFFSKPKIKKLRKIAGGDTYTIIYLKLQLLSLDNEGVLEYQGIENNFIEEMALTIDEDIDNVSVTINYLINQGLMEQIDENSYLLNETQVLIGSESQAAERVRKHRITQKALHCNTDVTNCNAIVTKCNTEIEIDKEIDKEIEKELDIDTDKEKASQASRRKETFPSIINNYTTNAELIDALNCYVEMRKKEKKFTPRALKINLTELDKLALDDLTKIDIINQTIGYGWKGFYPLKKEKQIDDGINNPYKSKGRAF